MDGASFEEISYEGYGPAGVAVFVDVLTDNRNRTAADVRHLFSKYGSNLGESGCVGWMFNRRGLLTIEKSKDVTEDDLMMLALEAGADDVRDEDDVFEVLTDPAALDAVETALTEAGITIAGAEITMIPDTTIALDGDDADKMEKLIEALEDLDDVQDVFSNADLPEEPED